MRISPITNNYSKAPSFGSFGKAAVKYALKEACHNIDNSEELKKRAQEIKLYYDKYSESKNIHVYAHSDADLSRPIYGVSVDGAEYRCTGWQKVCEKLPHIENEEATTEETTSEGTTTEEATTEEATSEKSRYKQMLLDYFPDMYYYSTPPFAERKYSSRVF